MKRNAFTPFVILILVPILSSFITLERKDEQCGAKRPDRPNVLILYMDDQGTLDAGCYGIKDIATPNIDKLSKEGILFTQAYAHTVCCPARAALLDCSTASTTTASPSRRTRKPV